MKLTAQIQIYNDQDRLGEEVRIVGTSDQGKGCGIVIFDMDGKIYELSADEVIEAIRRVSTEMQL